LIKLLLAEDGVDLDSKDKQGQTPLSWAVAKGHEAVVKLLLTEDAIDPDSKNIYGRTPLLLAGNDGEQGSRQAATGDEQSRPGLQGQ
jgi:ankyrin repeat protein